MRGATVVAASAATVCLGSRGFADALVPSLGRTPLHSGTSTSGWTSTTFGQQSRKGVQVRAYASSGTTKPSLKPSWKPPRPKAGSRRGTEARTIDPPMPLETETIEPPNGAVRKSHRSFEKPTWRTPKTAPSSTASPASSSPVLTESAPSTIAAGATILESSDVGASSITSSAPTASDTQEQASTSPDAPLPAPPAPTSSGSPSTLSTEKTGGNLGASLRRARDALFPMTETIRDNMAEGNIGERGEEWALGQLVLLLCIALGGVPVVGNLLMFLTGPVFIVLGSVLCAAGVFGLGKSLSPWPSPVDNNKLQTSGIFGIMRHPTYTGVIMLSLGFGVVTDSPTRMLLAVLLAVLLDRKAGTEEEMLVMKHGATYEAYRDSVAKFIPKLY